MFEALVIPVTMKELIAGGFLVPFTLIRPDRPLETDQIAASPADAYARDASGRKAFVFAAHLKAAREFRDQFNAAGVPAGLVAGPQAMPIAERRKALQQYKDGKIRVLVNVGVLTEGVDDRPTSCVIIARSVGSLSLYLQMFGRGLRTCVETGKKDAILLDLCGSSYTHGGPDEDHGWTLEGDGIAHRDKERGPERFCAVCGVLVEGDGVVCDLCGISRPELAVPTVVNARLVKYVAKLRETPEQRQAYFERLKSIARERKYNKWQPIMKFKSIYGTPPPRDWW